jgi:hypothetical protein
MPFRRKDLIAKQTMQTRIFTALKRGSKKKVGQAGQAKEYQRQPILFLTLTYPTLIHCLDG